MRTRIRNRGMLHKIIGVLMIVVAGLAVALKPETEVTAQAGPDLEALVPRQFGDWKAIPSANQFADLTPRGADAKEREFYDQTLLRTYQGPDGATVMLAVAYGRRQRQEVKVHRPELCYVSQGFEILGKQSASVGAGERDIPVTRLLARSPGRFEPITYWIRLGSGFSSGAVETRLTILKEGLLGNVPDGVLVRASTIARGGSAVESDYAVQQDFLKQLVEGLDDNGKTLLLGRGAATDSRQRQS